MWKGIISFCVYLIRVHFYSDTSSASSEAWTNSPHPPLASRSTQKKVNPFTAEEIARDPTLSSMKLPESLTARMGRTLKSFGNAKAGKDRHGKKKKWLFAVLYKILLLTKQYTHLRVLEICNYLSFAPQLACNCKGNQEIQDVCKKEKTKNKEDYLFILFTLFFSPLPP